jgi:hypothetical protein
MTDSSSQSDDYGNCRGRRKATYLTSTSIARRKKGALNAKERNLRRLESNERERMRMHSLNDAFQVSLVTVCFFSYLDVFIMLMKFLFCKNDFSSSWDLLVFTLGCLHAEKREKKKLK